MIYSRTSVARYCWSDVKLWQQTRRWLNKKTGKTTSIDKLLLFSQATLSKIMKLNVVINIARMEKLVLGVKNARSLCDA